MQPLRAYLLIFSASGCESSVHRDLESLCDAWKPYSGKDGITGVIHVGFGRPETEAFAVCAKKFQGRMLLSASAKWAMVSVCECAPIIAGEAETIPLFVALNGWGYETSAEEIGLANLISGGMSYPSTSTEGIGPPNAINKVSTINSLLLSTIENLRLTVRSYHCLKGRNINYIGDLVLCTEPSLLMTPNMGRKSFDEIQQSLTNLGLSLGMRLDDWPPINLGCAVNQLESESQTCSAEDYENRDDSISLIGLSPQWLLNVSLSHLDLNVRTFRALNSQGFNFVRDIKNIPSHAFLDIKNFGRTSLLDLENKLKVAIEIGPTSIAPEDALDNVWANSFANTINLSSAHSIKLGSRFKNIDTLVSVINAAVCSLPPNIEKVVRARMGLDSDPMTLEEIGKMMGVTRERVRQLEAKGVAQIGCDSVWQDGLEVKLAKFLDGRDDSLPFSGLPIFDDWFSGIEKISEPFSYLLKHKSVLDQRFSLLQVNGQLFVSRLTQTEWNKTLKQSMKLLEEGINHGWGLTEARRCVADLLGERGGELRYELWTAAKRFAHFSSPHADSEPILVSYGRGAEALVEAVITESDRPLHYSELPQLIEERYGKSIDVRRASNAASDVALLYGRGFYGLLKHCPLNNRERDLLREETLEIISHGESARQWSCAELVDILSQRGLDFDGRLDSYILNIALLDSKEIVYLGRNLWVQSSADAGGSSHRIDIRQAVTALLLQAGRPMSNSEIKEILCKDRGVSQAFQVFPSGSIISVGTGQWGLIERDLSINDNEQAQLTSILVKMLRDRNVGIHISEVISCLEGIFEPITRIRNAALIFSVVQRSGLASRSASGYLFLPEWGEPRRMQRSQAVLEVFKEAGDQGLTANEVLTRASNLLGFELQRNTLYSYMTTAGAKFNEEKKRWVIDRDAGELNGDE